MFILFLLFRHNLHNDLSTHLLGYLQTPKYATFGVEFEIYDAVTSLCGGLRQQKEEKNGRKNEIKERKKKRNKRKEGKAWNKIQRKERREGRNKRREERTKTKTKR